MCKSLLTNSMQQEYSVALSTEDTPNYRVTNCRATSNSVSRYRSYRAHKHIYNFLLLTVGLRPVRHDLLTWLEDPLFTLEGHDTSFSTSAFIMILGKDSNGNSKLLNLKSMHLQVSMVVVIVRSAALSF